jgi:hypothetical protein
MMTQNMKYSLNDINNIIFQGFDFKLPEETLKIISELALQVGSPDYVKTPVFQKRDNPMKVEPRESVFGGISRECNVTGGGGGFKKNRRNKATEIVNDEDWEAIRSFQPTKIEEKVGFDANLDQIRVLLNKLTDKNYIDICNKIVDFIDKLVKENITPENMKCLSSTIFEIASMNRFYSKVYADLYSELSTKFDIMKTITENNLCEFTGLFTTIEYVDPKINYDRFCEINKTNEKRKSLATFYLNLMNNSIIPKKTIMEITRNLLNQVYTFILSDEDKKNEVDELTETVAILYKKELYENDIGDDYELIFDFTISQVVEKIANSKVKDYKNLTNKTLFKFMDLIDM